MNPRLPYLNLGGVLALALLCVLQWGHDSRLNLDLARSEEARLRQNATLVDQTNQMDGLTKDLAHFKSSLADEQQLRSQAEIKLRAANLSNDQLTSDCEQLKTSVTNWSAAVALRDQRIQEANDRIGQLARDLDASIRKFNVLATNYNTLVENSRPKTNAAAP